MRVAVVTGGNKGIGLGICKELARLLPNFVTILTSRSEPEGQAAVASLRAVEGLGELDYHQLDVSDDASVARFKEFILHKYGRVDVLVNNGGNLHEGTVLTLNIKDFQDMLNVHAIGALRTTQAFLPLMRKHGYGRIINLSSGVGQLSVLAGPGMPTNLSGYALAKLALNGLTLLTAAEIKPEEDILVNALLPGFVRTDMSKKVVPDEFPQQVGSRWRTPEEVGGDVVHLVSQPGRDGPRGHLFLEGKQQPW